MWKSSYGKNLMQDNPWSSLPSPRCKHASGWQADTFVSCSKMSPAMTDLLFLSMHSSPCHCQLARQWHFPEGKSSPPVPGKCTGSVPAEPQDQEDPYIGFLKWCKLLQSCKLPALLSKSNVLALGSEGFLQRLFSSFPAHPHQWCLSIHLLLALFLRDPWGAWPIPSPSTDFVSRVSKKHSFLLHEHLVQMGKK